MAVLVFSLTPLIAQHEQHASATVQPRSPLIDGSKNPELISDRAAIRAFFVAVAEPLNAEPDQLKRLDAKLARIGLSKEDNLVLASHLTQFHSDLTRFADQIRALDLQLGANRNASPADLLKTRVALSSGLEDAAWTQYQGALTRLSVTGAAKLRAYLPIIKARIRIVPPPPM